MTIKEQFYLVLSMVIIITMGIFVSSCNNTTEITTQTSASPSAIHGGAETTPTTIEELIETFIPKSSTPSTSRGNVRNEKVTTAMFRLWQEHGGTYNYVPYCIAAYESGFDTNCHNTSGEDSRGLFQVNVANAHHRNNTDPQMLFDPIYNMEYQFDELVIYEKRGIEMGLQGIDLILYVARYGQRPNWSTQRYYIQNKVTSAYNTFSKLYN